MEKACIYISLVTGVEFMSDPISVRSHTKALFITFEGGEGAGKTTQINRLAEELTRKGEKVITTREPGGTPEGEKIRSLLVRGHDENWSPMVETLLMLSARSLHVERLISPALESGKIVICDRFCDSTIAYQGYGRGIPTDKIENISKEVLGDIKPDITFILDIDPGAGLTRSKKRLAGEGDISSGQAEDHFEKMDLSFHERVRQGFIEIANNDPERCYLISAEGSIDEISEKIKNILWDKLDND